MRKKELLKIAVGERLTTKRGFIVRTTPTQWRVVNVSGGRARWVETLVLLRNGFVVKL
jgi:hypothetical protein